MEKRSYLSRSSGFTIVELLVVIIVIAIMAAIAVVVYSGIQVRAKDAAKLAEVNQFTKQISLYQVEHGVYPTAIPEGGIISSSDREKNFVANVTTPDANHQQKQKRRTFEAAYGIKIPEGVVYYNDSTRSPATVYVMATFLDERNIPDENRSNRLRSGAQNGVWSNLVLYTQNPCVPPIGKLSPSVAQSRSSYGSGWAIIRDMLKHTATGRQYTTNPGDSAVTDTNISLYRVPGYEACGEVGYLEDWDIFGDSRGRNTRKSGVGLFVIDQGSP